MSEYTRYIILVWIKDKSQCTAATAGLDNSRHVDIVFQTLLVPELLLDSLCFVVGIIISCLHSLFKSVQHRKLS